MERTDQKSEARQRGEALRRQVMGASWVDAQIPAEDPMSDFGEAATERVWTGVWARPGLEPRIRSAVTITLMVAQKQSEELLAHARGALESGWFTREELKELVLHTSAYVGFPASRHGMQVLRELLMDQRYA